MFTVASACKILSDCTSDRVSEYGYYGRKYIYLSVIFRQFTIQLERYDPVINNQIIDK